MSSTPFLFRSAAIIPAVGLGRKCAISTLFLPLKAQNRSGYFPKDGFCHIAGSYAQDADRGHGVKIPDMPKVVGGGIELGINTTSCQHHVKHAGVQRVPEPYPKAVLIQILQHTPSLDFHELFQIVGQVVIHHIVDNALQGGGQPLNILYLTKAVDKGFNDGLLIPFLHMPDGDGAPFPAVGVGHIKDVAQTVALVGVPQQG